MDTRVGDLEIFGREREGGGRWGETRAWDLEKVEGRRKTERRETGPWK